MGVIVQEVDFNRDHKYGQMRDKERKAMYNSIIQHKCKNLLEIGTWKGGGSTYILASAALEINGNLHSIECNTEYLKDAMTLYQGDLKYLSDYVTFHLGESQNILPYLIKKVNFDFILFDGSNDAEQTLTEFNIIIQSNISIIAVHDWKIDKAKLIKPLLEDVLKFKNICLIEDTCTGFAMFRKL